MDRQGDLLLRQRPGPLDRPDDLVWNRRERGLRGDQSGIVDRRRHSARFEMSAKRRPPILGHTHGEEVPGGLEATARRNGPDVRVRYPLEITARDLRSAGVPLFQPGEEHVLEHSGVELIETAVHSDVQVLELRALPVVPESSGQLGDFRVIRNERAAVTQSPEVLGRVEAERRDQPHRPSRPPIMRRTQRLGTVLDHGDPVSALDVREASDVETASVEMDRHQEADLGVVFECLIREVQVEEPELVGIHEDWAPAGSHDCQGGRERAERRGQDLVSGPQAQNTEGQLDGIQATRTSDRMGAAAVGSDLLLEATNPLSQYVPAALADGCDGVQHVGPRVLPLANERAGRHRLLGIRHGTKLLRQR